VKETRPLSRIACRTCHLRQQFHEQTICLQCGCPESNRAVATQVTKDRN
jgi:ribosomal protein L37E